MNSSVVVTFPGLPPVFIASEEVPIHPISCLPVATLGLVAQAVPSYLAVLVTAG